VHHRTNLSGYILATKVHIDNRKNLLSSNISSTRPYNMVNFGPLAAEIGPLIWGTPANFNRFRITARYCSNGRQPNFVALNRGRHVYSAGRPSRWALAHISTLQYITIILYCFRYLQYNKVQKHTVLFTFIFIKGKL